MESRKVHKLLPYTEEEKREIWKEHGLKEDIIKSEIQAILDWFDKQPHLVDAGIDVDFIETLFVISKGSREKTKRKIDSLYQARSTFREIFERRKEFLNKNFYSWAIIVSIPKLHKLERITVGKIVDENPENFDLLEYFKTVFMIGEFRLKYDYVLAERWIFDCTNLNWFSLLPKINLILLQKAAVIFQDSVGIRMSGIHLLNAPPSIQHIISLFKQFVIPKIMNRVIVHSTLDELYQYVEKDYLPKDFGGTQKSIAELTETWLTEIREEETQRYLIDACERKSDESKRPGEKTIDPLAGSFKKLDLD